MKSARALALLAGAVLHVSAAAAADMVPLSFIGDLPFAKVTIGSVSTQMMFDSGGQLAISIPESAIARSGSVTLLDQTSKFSDLQGKVYEVRNLVARDVIVGATALAPLDGSVHVEWGGAPEGPEAALSRARQGGAIGLAAFGARPLMFDYGRARLTIYAAGEQPRAGQDGWQALPLSYGKEGPNISLVVNGKPLKFVLDTGARVNLVDPASLAPAGAGSGCLGAAACDPRELGDVKDSAGRSLGELAAERVQLNGAPFDGILGAPFFQRHRVLFDLAARRLLIAPALP